MTLCYRIMFGQANVYMREFFEFNNASQTRGHAYKLSRRHSYSSVRTSYFADRVINVWNALSADRVDFFFFCCI